MRNFYKCSRMRVRVKSEATPAKLLQATNLLKFMDIYNLGTVSRRTLEFQFVSVILYQYTKLIKGVPLYTSSYHHETAFLTKTYNRIFPSMLRCYVSDYQRYWYRYIWILICAYITSLHLSTEQFYLRSSSPTTYVIICKLLTSLQFSLPHWSMT